MRVTDAHGYVLQVLLNGFLKDPQPLRESMGMTGDRLSFVIAYGSQPHYLVCKADNRAVDFPYDFAKTLF